MVQVHDAATIGEIQQLEALNIVPKGEGWVASQRGRTEIRGDIPTNTDGGLLAMGHPFGASGIRMIHEIVTQLRGEAGPRQVKDPKWSCPLLWSWRHLDDPHPEEVIP